MGFVASNSRANIIVVADEEQLEKVMQVQINADNYLGNDDSEI